MQSTELWKEFKGFALKGNAIDLAVAVVIGGAFGAVVNSLVKNVIMPALEYILPSQGTYREWHLGRVQVGVFLGELVNFLVIALAMYLVMVKLTQALRRTGLISGAAPANRPCPYCLSSIPAKATKCAHCTSDLPPDL
jgi:large conductance mechanosensitive channel